MPKKTGSLHVLKTKLKEIGVKADKGVIGLVDNFVKMNVLADITESRMWLCPEQLQPQLQDLLQQQGVESHVIISEVGRRSTRFVYLRKNKIFEISSLSSFEKNYQERLQELCQDS